MKSDGGGAYSGWCQWRVEACWRWGNGAPRCRHGVLISALLGFWGDDEVCAVYAYAVMSVYYCIVSVFYDCVVVVGVLVVDGVDGVDVRAIRDGVRCRHVRYRNAL